MRKKVLQITFWVGVNIIGLPVSITHYFERPIYSNFEKRR